MSKERFNTFVDAIFAIIITIMVLEFRVPTTHGWAAISGLIEPVFIKPF